MSKTSQAEWYTPQRIFTALGLRFDLDPAGPVGGGTHVPAARFYTAEDDGLSRPWHGLVWLNPPYDRALHKWVAKMVDHGSGVLLTFVRSDATWWHRAAEAATAICFIRGRVRFIPGGYWPPGKRTPTDRPGASNCLFAFGPEAEAAVRGCRLGTVVTPQLQRVSALFE